MQLHLNSRPRDNPSIGCNSANCIAAKHWQDGDNLVQRTIQYAGNRGPIDYHTFNAQIGQGSDRGKSVLANLPESSSQLLQQKQNTAAQLIFLLRPQDSASADKTLCYKQTVYIIVSCQHRTSNSLNFSNRLHIWDSYHLSATHLKRLISIPTGESTGLACMERAASITNKIRSFLFIRAITNIYHICYLSSKCVSMPVNLIKKLASIQSPAWFSQVIHSN